MGDGEPKRGGDEKLPLIGLFGRAVAEIGWTFNATE